MKIKIIITSTDSYKTATALSECLLNENLSPCVQVTSKIQSLYNWKDKLEKSNEMIILIKTIPAKLQSCKEIIQKLHNYDVPEMIVIDGEILNDEYISWFEEHCREI